MKRELLAFAASFISTAAMAQNSFSGIDLSLGFALQNVTTGSGNQTNSSGSTASFDQTAKTSANGNLNIGYNFQINDSLILGLQASLQPVTSGAIQVQKVPGTPTEFQNNARFDFSILPGVLINPDNLLYGKVGYSYNKENVRNANGAWGTTLKYEGYVLGAGVKSFSLGNLLGVKNLYAFAEYNYAGYGNKGYSVINTSGNSVVSSGIKLNSSSGLVGLGYIF
jgi:hypothetical protein